MNALIAGPELAVRYVQTLKECDWWTDELALTAGREQLRLL
jgi:hypothetical protein